MPAFWGKYYAKDLGAAKAKLLIHYGMQMETPNAQNWPIQFGPDLLPAGVIVMRDIADSSHVAFIAKYNGAYEFLRMDADNFNVAKGLNPYYSNSVWQMNEGGVSERTLGEWKEIHDESYINTVKDLLNIKIELNTINKLDRYLQTEEGIELLKKYAKNHGLAFRRMNLENVYNSKEYYLSQILWPEIRTLVKARHMAWAGSPLLSKVAALNWPGMASNTRMIFI